MLIIGSVAMAMHGKSYRLSNDLDVVATFDELNQLTRYLKSTKAVASVLSIPYSPNKTVLKLVTKEPLAAGLPNVVEVEIAWPGSTAEELLALTKEKHSKIWQTLGTDVLGRSRIADFDVLLTLKLSHRYLKNSVHFEKTMRDIKMLRYWKAKVFNEDWLKRREKETYNYGHPKLNTSKNQFFKMNEGVQYIFDHDSIHRAMAHIPIIQVWKQPAEEKLVPAYKLYAGEGEVQSSKEKFFSVSEAVRRYGVLEEAQVLALERSQIPFGIDGPPIGRIRKAHGIKLPHNPPTPRQSFKMALEKVCTSITSGWFREYAWEHYEEIDAMYEPDYVEKFWEAVRTGVAFRTPDSLKKEQEYDHRRDASGS